MKNEWDRTSRFLSPFWLSSVASIVVVALSFTPTHFYESVMGEKDLMFLDATLYVFVVACLGGFVLGLLVMRRLLPCTTKTTLVYRSGTWLPVALACFSLGVAVWAAKEFAGSSSLMDALSAGQGEALRRQALDAADEGLTAQRLVPAGSPLLLWAVYRSIDSTGLQRRIIYFCVAAYVVCLVLILQRNILIPFVLAASILISATRFGKAGMNVKRLLTLSFAAGFAVLGSFLAIAQFRGASQGGRGVAYSLTGYLPASVNRLSAVLQGAYNPEFPDEPAFTFRFLWYPPFVRRFVNLRDLHEFFGVQLPLEPLGLWRSEFVQVATGHLNGEFIWATAFGYSFYDFRWLSPIYFFALGLAAQAVWRAFQARRIVGVIVYPYFAAAILLWPTDNFMSYPQLWLYGMVVVALTAVDRPISRKLGDADVGDSQLRTIGR